ncbi:MAG TPA: ABC transporter substrate-binding protein [Gaiellaceae bacterium]|nr:ABC transporter substrate-binding protein [Gaiellaceae bacterium]
MRTTTLKRPAKLSVAVLAAIAVILAGYVASTASAKRSENVTLRVDLFGDFGYHELYKQFEAAHPGVTIKEDIEDYATHHANLAKHLATGAGADDVEAVEVGFIAQFKSEPQYFVDLNSLGAASLKSQWLPWKWQQSIAPNGAQIGLGSDVGSMGICYRKDLFQSAGLPTDRAAVSKLWPTWQAYINTGVKFEKNAPKGTFFFDSGSNVFNAMIGQLNPAYYDAKGNVIVGTNPGVKNAWNLTMQGISKGESAGLAAFSTAWNTGYQQSTFATVTCPAWMMGYIQGQAPKSAGDWDIASVPGDGGSWGGSFLTIPKQSKNQQLAYELIKFLTSPSSELYVFKHTGNLPSEPALYSNPALANFKNSFFSNAPVGKIFTTSVKRLKPQITGPHQGDIQTASSNAIQRVEQKKQTPSTSWSQFLKDVTNVAT